MMLCCAFLLAAAAEPPPLDVRAICARVRCPDDYNYTRYVDESGACRCGLLTPPPDCAYCDSVALTLPLDPPAPLPPYEAPSPPTVPDPPAAPPSPSPPPHAPPPPPPPPCAVEVVHAAYGGNAGCAVAGGPHDDTAQLFA